MYTSYCSYARPAQFSILVTVRLYTVMPEVCRWLIYEKQRKTDICLKVGSCPNDDNFV